MTDPRLDELLRAAVQAERERLYRAGVPAFADERAGWLAEQYAAGATVYDLAERVGQSPQAVAHAMRTRGYLMRPPGSPPRARRKPGA